MCRGCYLHAGAPKVDTPAVRAAAEAIEALYEHPSGITGGALHVVVDDWNLETAVLAACQKDIGRFEPEARARYGDPPGLTALEQAAFDALLPLTLEHRASALAIAQGMWDPDVAPT